MSRPAIARFALFAAAFTILHPSLSSAQSDDPSAGCRPGFASTDDFKEIIGEKVYPKIVIDSVQIDGAMRMPQSVIDVIASIKEREFTGGSGWLEGIEEVGVQAAWQDQGFFRAEVTGESRLLIEDSTTQHYSLNIHVNEGIQYRLGEIRFRVANDSTPSITASRGTQVQENPPPNGETGTTRASNAPPSKPALPKRPPLPPDDNSLALSLGGAPAFPPEQLRLLIPMPDGDLFSVAKIRNGFDALKELYASRGYIDFAPTPFIDLDDIRQRVNLTLELDEQPQYRVGKIEFRGLAPGVESQLRLKLKPGDPFDNSLVEDFFVENKSLLPAGVSKSNVGLKKNARNATVNLTFCLRGCPQS
jgi:outer membrane protein assembly factor BamA